MIGELCHVFRTAAKRCAVIGIDALQIVEKSGRRDVARNPEARSVGNRAVRLEEESALVVPDIFIVIRARPSGSARSAWITWRRSSDANTGRKELRNKQSYNQSCDRGNVRWKAESQGSVPRP